MDEESSEYQDFYGYNHHEFTFADYFINANPFE